MIAFGEVGLDLTEPLKYWAYQVELLEKVLPYLEDRHVLVIHCRGMIGDCGTEAFLLLLHFLKKNVRQHQQIHLHCFTGNSYVLDRWLEVFPRTYFGFTNKVGRFNRNQREALCKIEENRMYSSLMPHISRLKVKQFPHPDNCTFLRRLWQHTVS